MINWVKILYTDFQANTQNNGHFSDRFPIKRGVHQGGPALSLLFLICAELLALTLKSEGDIKGIPVHEILKLLGQYADDADIYLLKDQKSLDSVFLIIERFRQMSGFTLNYDKTTILRIGSFRDSNQTLLTQKTVSWTNEPINVLGIKVTTDTSCIERSNYDEVYLKIRGVLSASENRSASLLAKVMIVNTLVTSLLVYKLTVFPMMSPNLLRKINEDISRFIWNNKKPKIKKGIMKMRKHDGGPGLTDIVAKNKSLKMSWIQILESEPQLKQIVFTNSIPNIGDHIWDCDLEVTDVKGFIKDPFWREVFEAWFEFKSRNDNNSRTGDCILWLNSKIRIEGKPILWTKCLQKGLLKANQLIKGGEWISFEDANKLFELSKMEFNSIKSSIPVNIKGEIQKA